MTSTAKIVSTALFLILIVSTAVTAQSTDREIKKDRKSFLLKYDNFKNANMPALAKLKYKTDNDIGQWVEQYFDGEEWMDEARATYSYSNDRLTITQDFQFYSEGAWLSEGSVVITFNAEGYPLKLSFEFFDEMYSEEFYYSESGRLDSLTFIEEYEGETYSEKAELIYVTDDSIKINNVYTEGGETITEDGGYFVHKNGNLIEAYDEGDYIDRYVYYGISFDDLLRNLTNEFFFVEVYNDEFYNSEEGWVPYSRITLTKENSVVVEMLTEYYDDTTEEEWIPETRNTYVYEDGKIVQDDEAWSFDGVEWTEDYRTLYTYGEVVSAEQDPKHVSSFKLSQNYPNPFNPTTQISYTISQPGNVQLEVYNILGKKVATLVNAPQNVGEFTVTFDARNLPSGIYYYKLLSAGSVKVKSMTLIK